MSITTFDVDREMIREDFFKQNAEFSADSIPSADSVDRFVDQEAAELEAKLLQESITASSITDDESAAFLWCQRTLSLLVAIRVMEAMAQQDTTLLKVWRDRLDARFKALDEKGYLALGGGVSAPTSQPNGPTHHIDTYGLDVGDTSLASSVAPVLRRDDQL